jgi:hypothetical protein
VVELSEKANRCLQHYLAVYQRELQLGSNGLALNECLHHFLDQRPAGKNVSAFDRAAGLAAAPFWWDSLAVSTAPLAALALCRVLHHEEAISIELLEHLAHANPDVLRWAIRYAKLFTRGDSALWAQLRQRLQGEDWRVFFGVCDRLLEQLQPYAELVDFAEQKLAHLSLLEVLSYLSVLAYEKMTPDAVADPSGKLWKVYDRIILNKLKTCSEKDFDLSEARLGQSLKKHISPILFPSPAITLECRENLEAITVLIEAMQELIDYEGSIDWFCFDPECRYQLKPGDSVIYNETENGSREWQRTERKSLALWHYWMYRGLNEFVARGMAEVQIGSAENHELNAEAYIKAIRSELQLKAIYGLDDELELADGSRANLFQAMLASELTTVFFQSAYIQPFQQHYTECGVLAQALSKLALNGLVTGENRFPMTWSEEAEKIKKIKDWTVCSDYPDGNMVAAKGILDFWTNDLKALSSSLKQQPNQPVPRLSELPFSKIGRYNFQFPWVVAKQNNLTAAVNNLRRIGARRVGTMSETRRIELRLAEQMRERGFAVVVGYQPERTEHEDPGEVDLICYRDGVVLLLEVKSGYIRRSSHEVWLHRTNTLRKAAWQLRRKRVAVVDALARDEQLRTSLGCTAEHPSSRLHAWIVDTSIELDQQMIDGFLVVSLEALQVVMRDERQLLCQGEQLPEDSDDTMFPDGFRAAQFVAVVERGDVWAQLD